MTFNEQLNEYISALACSAKELAEASGLSESVISRYRSGIRVPEAGSTQFEGLVNGICLLAEKKHVAELTKDSVRNKLLQALNDQAFPFEQFQKNLDILLSRLSVNVADLAHTLNFDSSYISRIRNGQRKPADPVHFSADVAKFVANRLTPSDEETLAGLLGVPAEELRDKDSCIKRLVGWLANGTTEKEDATVPFLTKLDEFDLNEFIRSIRFDELKVPTMPFQLPTSKNYYGIEEMCKGTLDFFKATVLSKSMEDFIANDDTPMADKAAGTDFMKKYIFAVALTLKKGLHIHFIHNINRPFEEMMMGLEGWIPMYMTGQISPYYLSGTHNKLFGHFIYSSGAAALSGECIIGHHEHGKMYLTNNKAELSYYRQRAKDLLSKALPLMDIYRVEQANAFDAFMEKHYSEPGTRRSMLSALPIHTLTDDLLERILAHNDVTAEEKTAIADFVSRQREQYETLLARDMLTEEIPMMEREEFEQHPMYLPLAELFMEKDIAYSYEEYLDHLALIENYCASHENYVVKKNRAYPFRNIQIRIHEGNWALISKSKAPAIHFVIRNPQLRNALENMVIPVVEEDDLQ